jgi:hypothetical protein
MMRRHLGLKSPQDLLADLQQGFATLRAMPPTEERAAA